MVIHENLHKRKSGVPALLIAVAAMMWGTIGIFGSIMIQQGLSPTITGCLKLLTSSILMLLYFFNGHMAYLRIRWRHIGWLLSMAFLTQAVFNFSYYTVVAEMGVTQAGILLYLMPIFLTVWSVMFFDERINRYKIIGILICLSGSFLALTGGVLDVSAFSFKGVLLGLVAAISFSLVSVFSKILLRELKPLTVIFYAFFFGGLMMLPFVDIASALPQILTPVSIGSILGIACIGSVLPYFVYFKGIDMGVDLSKAGVICVMELVTSIILATMILGEQLSAIKTVGIFAIISAIIIIQQGSVDK